MGLWSLLNPWRKKTEVAPPPATAKSATAKRSRSRMRKARFEEVESRRMMDADPLKVGMIYIEEDSGSDLHGDTFEIKFEGGAPGTQLTQLIIDTDKNAPGLGVGDLFFDTIKGGLGADEAFPMQIVSANGIQEVTWSVADGGTKLILNFKGFDVGEKLVFSIDVDEVQEYDPNETNMNLVNEGIDPITSGVEFQGSLLTGTFTAPYYYEVSGTSEFRNNYDPLFAGTTLLRTDSNPSGVPFDNFEGKRDRSTGTMLPLQQVPLPVSIGGRVYLEKDLDLVQDPGEQGLSGVTLGLWKKQGNSYVFTGHTTTTDALGDYEFGTDLDLTPGTYQVRETQPTGYFSVGAIVGKVGGTTVGSTVSGDKDILTEIHIPHGDLHGVRYDFAEALPAAVSGFVYVDADNDGIFDPGETPLAGVQIQVIPLNTISSQNTIILTTNASGYYEATGLAPGTYRIVQPTQPTGYFDGLDTPGTVNGVQVGTVNNPGDSLEMIVLGGGGVGIQYNFGELEPSSISGNVHLTNRDGDCYYEGYENNPVVGAVIQLKDANGNVIAQTLTDSQGNYKFENLRPGVYTIVEQTPAGLIDGGDHIGTVGGTANGTKSANDTISNIVLGSGQSGVKYDFCEKLPASVSGYVYYDKNNNGLFESGENPIPGTTVILFDAGGMQIATQITDATGFYKFDGLSAGNYRIVEVQPVDYLDGKDTPGTIGGTTVGTADNPGDTLRGVQLLWGDAGVQYNFGEIIPATIHGRVFYDPDQNLLLTPGDEAIAGVTVELLDQNGTVIRTTQTNANGEYKFTGLPPGTYTVREQQPAGYLQGGQVVGSHGGNASVTDILSQLIVNSGDDLIEYNFAELKAASISGTVWVDTIPNCELDSGEALLAGVVIRLYNQQGELVATTQTNALGRYEFVGLRPGVYTVTEQQPTGYFDGCENAGSEGGDDSQDDVISQITLGSGVTAVNYDFSEIPPAALSGYVFQDGPAIVTPDGQVPSNLEDLRDGKLTADDIRIGGVLLELRHTLTGELVTADEALPGTYPPGAIRVWTDANGFYQFRGLKAGNYSVFQAQPEGYIDSLDTEGTTSGLAVNRTTQVSPLLVQRFASQGVNFRFDAILQIPLAAGQESQLNNFSEVKITTFLIPLDPPKIEDPIEEEPLFIPPLVLDVLPPPPPLPIKPADIITGGGGTFTWHLSIIDAGLPRNNGRATRMSDVVFRSVLFVDQAEWQSDKLREGIWTIHSGEDAVESPHFAFGIPGARPVVGDWNGDGRAELGVFYKGEWFLDLNGNGKWDEGDLWAKLGDENDQPVVGDWDGDGKDDIGIFGPEWPGDPRHIENEPGLPDPDNVPKAKAKNLPPNYDEATDGERLLRLTARGKERADLIDHVFQFGHGADIAVTGDWNGDGITSIGVFRDGKWHLDMDSDGRWSAGDKVAYFGAKGDRPVVGDFNGDGIDELGVFRGGKFYLDTNSNRELDDADDMIEFGQAGDRPAVGDFNGDGIDEVAVYRDNPGAPPSVDSQ